MTTSKQILERFWTAMQTNDFVAASELLHDDYLLEWPQSGERIRGRANFVAVNANYPAHGRWEFTIHRILAEGDEVVSDVSVTDGSFGRVPSHSRPCETERSCARPSSGRIPSKHLRGAPSGWRR